MRHDAGGNLYNVLLDARDKSSMVSICHLKASCNAAFHGVSQTWRRKSEGLKRTLLKELRHPSTVGALWCWLIPHASVPHLARGGEIVRLVCFNSVLGDEDTFYTFRTRDDYLIPQPGDDGVFTLHSNQFVLAWTNEGEDMDSGLWTKGRSLELIATLGFQDSESSESSDDTQLYEGEYQAHMD